MKRLLLVFTISLSAFIYKTYSQPWNYNLGTVTGTFSTSGGVSTTFLPAPPIGNTRIRVSTTGGSFNLEDQSISFGENVYLRIVAPYSGAVNKFSLYDYTPSKTFTLRFNVRFGASDGSGTAASGIWYLIIGDGATFSDNNGFAGLQTFNALRFTFGASGAITTNLRVGSNWVATGITGTPFAQATNYSVEIYCNNSTSTQYYNHGDLQTVAPDKWDFWVDGVLVGNDLGKALMLNDLNIDSWMFYGESSIGNVANIFLDDFYFQNSIAGDPLPVHISSFNASNESLRDVVLTWVTEDEINNAGFDVERRSVRNSAGSGESSYSPWQKICFIQGYGTTFESHFYNLTDYKLNTGKYEYRLKQLDNNGNFEYFNLQNPAIVEIGTPVSAEIGQNYPNPSNPKCRIDYQLPYAAEVSIKVFDITGREVITLVNEHKTEGYYTTEFDGTGLATGIYFYRTIFEGNNEKFSSTKKMIIVK
jgi:hypothetical protein